MWFNTGAARVGDGACACVRPVASGVGPKCGTGLGTWQCSGRLAVKWQAGSGPGTAVAMAVCAYAYASIDDAYAYMHMLIRELIRALIHANTCYWQSISMLIQVDIQY